ncbi:S9 family peptidase [Amycolatopsis regifaucium]|uniref:Peptidase S9 n=1 Tax=Amycolatopsis regifaucium TaxID=546365 RepID=A0A154MCQ4_9PSEU|nr:prolyl oligopeptidase family serine peptidase [Amycolatopsis regifaucium]KZB82276.1 peptidase S9 [Amycolatopsis regifaucium]OKA05652.1 S9 family peptidase [Amycolatopsis regifaucium]SFG88362.1 Dipeptidyl aminopeptidase/acylaminoacyl peptidase [Amycolatopsis regifaucium]
MLTAELIVDSHVPAEPALSPDGRRIAYQVTTVTAGIPEIWLAAVDGGEKPRKLAEGSSPKWSPDSATLYFLRDGRLYAEGVPEPLITWGSAITAFLPMRERIVFIAEDEAPVLDPWVWSESLRRPARLRSHELRTGEVGTLTDDHVVDIARRPDDGALAILTWPTPELDPGGLEPRLSLLDPETGARRDLGQTAVEATNPVWWRDHDGWHVTYLATPEMVGGWAVFDVPVETGEHRNLTPESACPIRLAQVDSGAPLVLVADGLDTALHRLGSGEVSFWRGQADALTSNGEIVATVLSTAYRPKDVHCGPVGGPLTRVSDTAPEFAAFSWGTQERLSYKASDGLLLDGLLVLPPGKSRGDGPFSLVVLPHGGPYDRNADRFMLNWYPSAQWLAAAGHAVFLPNPRGGQGHGHEFAASVAGRVGMEEWSDLQTGIDLLVDEGVADPERLGIAGWSHGGFVAAWAVGQTHRFKAALMGAGICDWGMLAATGELGPLEAALGGSFGWEGKGPHRHDQLSPISYASKIETPVLIVHGADDTNVPLSQAEFFHRALRHFGVEHDLVVYPGEGHRIGGREHQLDLLRRTREWFSRLL